MQTYGNIYGIVCTCNDFADISFIDYSNQEFNMYKGVQQTANRLGLLNAEEYAVIKNEMFAFGGQSMPFANTAIGEGTNWQDSVFQTSPVESYNIGISGGTKNTRYSLGATYYAQEGIVGGSKANFSRYNARLNLSTDLSDKLLLNSVTKYFKLTQRRNGCRVVSVIPHF